jgi:hypothetical protein
MLRTPKICLLGSFVCLLLKRSMAIPNWLKLTDEFVEDCLSMIEVSLMVFPVRFLRMAHSSDVQEQPYGVAVDSDRASHQMHRVHELPKLDCVRADAPLIKRTQWRKDHRCRDVADVGTPEEWLRIKF